MTKRKKEGKEEKSSKKAKTEENNEIIEEDNAEEINTPVEVTPKKDKKDKKDKKEKKDKKDKKSKKDKSSEEGSVSVEVTPTKKSKEEKVKSDKKKKKEQKKETAVEEESAANNGGDDGDDGFVIKGPDSSFNLNNGKLKLGGNTSNSTPCDRIYIGGIPYSYREKDLRNLFEKYGEIVDMYIPEMQDNPGKIKGHAFISYRSTEEAEKALELNGYQCGPKALKVEFSIPKNNNSGGGKFGGGGGNKGGNKGQRGRDFSPLDPNVPEGVDSLFVGNLSYQVQDENIYDFFKDLDVKEIRYVEDRNTKEFKGSAFVQFGDRESLSKAGQLNGQMMCNRQIFLDYAKPKNR